MNEILEVNLNENLQIIIKNNKPVELKDLSLALLGVGEQFEKFIENETSTKNEKSSELFVKEVSSGSIVIDLMAQALTVAPLFWQGNSVLEWVSYAKSVFDWLAGDLQEAPKTLTSNDLKQWSNIIEPIAKDNGSQMNFSVASGGIVVNQFFIDSKQANAAQNEIRRQLDIIKKTEDNCLKKKVMIWYQTKFDENSQTGSKAIIESISENPIKVVFKDLSVKKALMAGNSKFSKPWNELAYIVDVNVETIRGVPKVYTIEAYYEDETFDPLD